MVEVPVDEVVVVFHRATLRRPRPVVVIIIVSTPGPQAVDHVAISVVGVEVVVVHSHKVLVMLVGLLRRAVLLVSGIGGARASR
jgi:hypothetical protein